MKRNSYGEPILTGNESELALVDLLADVVGTALYETFCGEGNPGITVEVVEGFQPYLTVSLSNGCQWQLVPVRSSWPTDGTSAQWDDMEDDDAA